MNAEIVSQCRATIDMNEAEEMFADAVENQQKELRNQGKFGQAVICRRTLRNERLFKAAYEHWLSTGVTAFVAQRGEVNASELGDGELLKWLLEWFSNGGWQVIIEFIKALIPLFGGLI